MIERTLIVIKPQAVERGLVGVFLQRFERMGFKILKLKVIEGLKELWDKFYPSDSGWLAKAGQKTLVNYRDNKIDPKKELGTDEPVQIGAKVREWLIESMSSGNSVAVVLEGNEALTKVRITCGNTLPNSATPGTIRFDFSSDSPGLANMERRPVCNLIHASDPDERRGEYKAVNYEIGILFPE
ncbi:MAG: nucleoside-diphosphate kinase [bacterium]